jgi:hypothetical protein
LQEQMSQRNFSWHTENCAWMSDSDMMSTLSLHLGQLRHGGVFSRHWHLRRCSLHRQCRQTTSQLEGCVGNLHDHRTVQKDMVSENAA